MTTIQVFYLNPDCVHSVSLALVYSIKPTRKLVNGDVYSINNGFHPGILLDPMGLLLGNSTKSNVDILLYEWSSR